jgi:hypothetical protein
MRARMKTPRVVEGRVTSGNSLTINKEQAVA